MWLPPASLISNKSPPAAILNVLLGKLLRAVPRMENKIVELGSIELLKALIYERSTITLVGKFVHDVLEVFYRLPVHRPSRRGN